MGAAYFYHLVERPLEATLGTLVEKAREAGWRVAVVGRDPRLLDRLDAALWMGDGFLPHGRAGGPHDADQPVLLTETTPVNNPDCIMTVDGADVVPETVARLARHCILFSAAETALLDRARDQWRQMTSAGIEAQYWSDEGGRWTKKAENASKAD